MRNKKLETGDFIKIDNPGMNRPTSWMEAEGLGSKWFKGISIMEKPEVYNESGWYIVNIDENDNLCLIRNKTLKLDLLIRVSALKIDDIYINFFTDKDFKI